MRRGDAAIGRCREKLGSVTDQLEFGDVADQLVFCLAQVVACRQMSSSQMFVRRSVADVRAHALLQR